MLLAPGELRKLRLHQEEFVDALAARLSLYLRLEFSLKLTSLQTIAYGKWRKAGPIPRISRFSKLNRCAAFPFWKFRPALV